VVAVDYGVAPVCFSIYDTFEVPVAPVVVFGDDYGSAGFDQLVKVGVLLGTAGDEEWGSAECGAVFGFLQEIIEQRAVFFTR